MHRVLEDEGAETLEKTREPFLLHHSAEAVEETFVPTKTESYTDLWQVEKLKINTLS